MRSIFSGYKLVNLSSVEITDLKFPKSSCSFAYFKFNFKSLGFFKICSNEICEFFAQSGSFKTFEAAQSQIVQLGKIGYEAFPEKVRSSNDFNYRVRVGPFENRSAMNNAREDFRRLNMDSMEIKYCKKISDDSD